MTTAGKRMAINIHQVINLVQLFFADAICDISCLNSIFTVAVFARNLLTRELFDLVLFAFLAEVSCKNVVVANLVVFDELGNVPAFSPVGMKQQFSFRLWIILLKLFKTLNQIWNALAKLISEYETNDKFIR